MNGKMNNPGGLLADELPVNGYIILQCLRLNFKKGIQARTNGVVLDVF